MRCIGPINWLYRLITLCIIGNVSICVLDWVLPLLKVPQLNILCFSALDRRPPKVFRVKRYSLPPDQTFAYLPAGPKGLLNLRDPPVVGVGLGSPAVRAARLITLAIGAHGEKSNSALGSAHYILEYRRRALYVSIDRRQSRTSNAVKQKPPVLAHYETLFAAAGGGFNNRCLSPVRCKVHRFIAGTGCLNNRYVGKELTPGSQTMCDV